MEFRSPVVAAQQNATAIDYLTKNLDDPVQGQLDVEELIKDLGNVVDSYPDWHPLVTIPQTSDAIHGHDLNQIAAYAGLDHTIKFVRGFVTIPYSDKTADIIVERVNGLGTWNLRAERLAAPLYSNGAFPVVVRAEIVELEGDGTIRGRDALGWFAANLTRNASRAQVAETWWSIKGEILGRPYGSRSSLFVNQHTGGHMRKVLDVMNDSGMFGPVKEWSLAMLSKKKTNKLCDTLIRTAVENWNRKSEKFTFELHGETCKASMRDTWKDNTEISVSVEIGEHDLYVSGFYHPKDGTISHTEPHGKRALAEKFV